MERCIVVSEETGCHVIHSIPELQQQCPKKKKKGYPGSFHAKSLCLQRQIRERWCPKTKGETPKAMIVNMGQNHPINTPKHIKTGQEQKARY